MGSGACALGGVENARAPAQRVAGSPGSRRTSPRVVPGLPGSRWRTPTPRPGEPCRTLVRTAARPPRAREAVAVAVTAPRRAGLAHAVTDASSPRRAKASGRLRALGLVLRGVGGGAVAVPARRPGHAAEEALGPIGGEAVLLDPAREGSEQRDPGGVHV